jgi:maleylacetate reductase
MKLGQFVYQYQPNRVVFGYGSLQKLMEEIEKLGCSKALILCTPEQINQAELVKNILGENAVGVFDKAVMHVPVETAREASKVAAELGADCAIAIGGGSTIGLGKAIALEHSLPIIAIPTTYAGSEMTPIYGLTENNIKKTGKDFRVLPKTVIYDPELTLSLPLEVSLSSGMNAIAHAAEGLYAQDGNPIMMLLAEEGIRALAEGLQSLKLNDQDLEARSLCLYGAWLCGTVLGNVGMALHHKLCHTLGGTFNLPHAPTHTVVLPQAIAYNEVARPEVTEIITRALKVTGVTAGQALFDLETKLGLSTKLSDLKFTESDIQKATDIAMSNPYWNPRPFGHDDIQEILKKACLGIRP